MLQRPLPGSVVAAYRKDPAIRGVGVVELVLYPGLWALAVHRVSNRLWRTGIPFVPRLLSQAVRMITGVEIHPGATIGRRLFIDHGAGVVIGETAEIGDDVMMYHGVTLGGHGWWADAKGSRRHPRIGDDVTLGVGASVLGDITVGAHSRIGPHTIVIDDVPPDSIVVAPKGRIRVQRGVRIDDDAGADLIEPTWLENHEMGAL
ncbi:MAG: serine acetyltransferase [Acidimicrobiia bacterium]|nr:serine acetyltransferase [Acidimicrobiia bacterium]